MGERPQFSVIIPTHNRLRLLNRALASVARQTFRDYESIVVDDGSSDGTWDYLGSLVPTITRSAKKTGVLGLHAISEHSMRAGPT